MEQKSINLTYPLKFSLENCELKSNYLVFLNYIFFVIYFFKDDQ